MKRDIDEHFILDEVTTILIYKDCIHVHYGSSISIKYPVNEYGWKYREDGQFLIYQDDPDNVIFIMHISRVRHIKFEHETPSS